MELDQPLERVCQVLEKGEPFSDNAKDMEYWSKLMFAYDGLDESAKDAFLDICIFFNGWNWDEVGCIVGEKELRALEEKNLVKKTADKKANVHDVLVGISRTKSKNVRITSTEELTHALKDQKITGEIKGIWFNHNENLYSDLSAEKLDEMHGSLRILALGGRTMIEGTCKEKFKKLRFLQAGDVSNLPFNISMLDQLRFLDNGSPQHIGFNNPSQIPATLGVLRLCARSYSENLDIPPQFLDNLSELRSLKLQGFSSLFELPEGLERLTKLVKLDVSQCASLFQLPHRLGDLEALQDLNLSYCNGLTQLPETIGELQHLETLNLEGFLNVKTLPANFGMLKSLRFVCLKQCKSLQELPESFGSLSSLQHLDLSFCDGICRLPSSFDQLVSLRVLYLTWCNNLLYLPDNLGNLTSLVKLEIFCHKLQRLPRSIGKLKSLSNYLLMYQCFELRELPEEFCDLNLEMLELPDLFGLERLPDRFMELTRLKHLRMESCKSLVRLPIGFGKLPVLEELNLDSCIKLQELSTDFHCLPSLKKLILSRCVVLDGIWMETVVKVNSLNFVDITESCRLEDRWMELRQTKDWEIIVNTDKDQDEDGQILKKAASMFFNDECSVFDCHGTPFKPSTLTSNTKLVLVFEWNISLDRWKQLMENIQGLLTDCIDPQIIYVRKGYAVSDASIQVRMKKLNGTTLGLACDYSKLRVLFDALVSKVIGSTYSAGGGNYVIITTVVDKDGKKQFSEWENITHFLEERDL